MAHLKHVGRLKKNKRRAIVAYRTVPSEPTNALVVLTESLPADEHDALIRLVESANGQQSNELAEAMFRTVMPDGRNMLAALHATGQLRKVPTIEIEMTPDTNTSIGLNELNEIIAQQRGVAIDDLAMKPVVTEEVVANDAKIKAAAEAAQAELDALNANQAIDPVVQAMQAAIAPVVSDELVAPEPLDSNALATQMRSHADAMFKEAQALRKQADTLAPKTVATKVAPVKKPAAKKKTSG